MMITLFGELSDGELLDTLAFDRPAFDQFPPCSCTDRPDLFEDYDHGD